MNASAVLLTGGESRRMGQDKATLVFRGKPLWQHQLQTLRELEPTEIFVSARSEPAWRPNDVQFVADHAPSRGPLSGLAAAVTRITTPHLVALAIDMPLMTADYLRFLATAATAGRGVIPLIDNRAEPLAAVYPREATAELSFALGSGDFSLQSVVRALIAVDRLMPVRVAAADQALFRNLNEPVDVPAQ